MTTHYLLFAYSDGHPFKRTGDHCTITTLRGELVATMPFKNYNHACFYVHAPRLMRELMNAQSMAHVDKVRAEVESLLRGIGE